jgi:hypothetical protein
VINAELTMNQTSFKLTYRDLAAVCLLATSNLAVAVDDNAYVVTPYRPTVSTPANLSTPGWLELETGLQALGNPDSSRRDSLPYSVKLALTPDWGVRIGGELLVRAPADFGVRAAGFGDTSLVIKRRFALDDSSALGLEFGANLPTGRNALHSGSGRSDYTVNGIYSSDFASHWHTDLNLALTHTGQADAGADRQQWAWAASVSHDLGGGWGLAGELSGLQQAGAVNTRQWLLAASYNPVSALTLDAGFAHAIGGNGPSWSVFAGATLPLGKIY